MVFILIGVLIIIYSFFDFKKGFSLYLCYKLVLVTNITLISKPGLPLLTLEMAMTLLYLFMFFLTGKKYQSAHKKFPLTIPFVLYCISMIISSCFSVVGFGGELSNLIKQFSENVLLVWMAWQILETKEDFIFLFKVVTVIILGSCIYGFIEYIIGNNPLTAYEATLNPGNSIDWSYSAESSRGGRINSIFEHAIGAGMNWALYAVLVFNLIQNKSAGIKKFIIPVITAILCIFCMFLTNSRSPILFFIIALCSIINFKSKRFYFLMFAFIIGGIICIPFLPENVSNIILSLLDENVASNIGGSSIEMRLDQLSAAVALFIQSPAFGFGPSFKDVMQGDLVDRLLGGESVWFQVLPALGGLGIVAYIVQIYYTVVKLPQKYGSRQILFVSLAYWLTYTITSIPGFITIMFYVFIFYCIKTSENYKKAIEEGKIYGVYLCRGTIRYNVIKRENLRQKIYERD